jgi:hypothetical protein
MILGSRMHFVVDSGPCTGSSLTGVRVAADARITHGIANYLVAVLAPHLLGRGCYFAPLVGMRQAATPRRSNHTSDGVRAIRTATPPHCGHRRTIPGPRS